MIGSNIWDVGIALGKFWKAVIFGFAGKLQFNTQNPGTLCFSLYRFMSQIDTEQKITVIWKSPVVSIPVFQFVAHIPLRTVGSNYKIRSSHSIHKLYIYLRHKCSERKYSIYNTHM